MSLLIWRLYIDKMGFSTEAGEEDSIEKPEVDPDQVFRLLLLTADHNDDDKTQKESKQA
jgi:hypothetical protein